MHLVLELAQPHGDASQPERSRVGRSLAVERVEPRQCDVGRRQPSQVCRAQRRGARVGPLLRAGIEVPEPAHRLGGKDLLAGAVEVALAGQVSVSDRVGEYLRGDRHLGAQLLRRDRGEVAPRPGATRAGPQDHAGQEGSPGEGARAGAGSRPRGTPWLRAAHAGPGLPVRDANL